jgi:hypothetical protein
MRFRFLAIACLCTAAASAADSSLLKYVMPDAKVVSGVNVDNVMLTPFGKFVLSILPTPDPGFEQFISATGFDPRRDIHEILMASTAEPGKRTGLLLLRGNFDRQRVLSLLTAVGKTPQMYNGSELLAAEPRANAISQALAFLDDSTAAAGDLDSVKAAIDRHNLTATLDPALTAKIGAVSAVEDAWVVSMAPISSFAKSVPNKNVSGALQGDVIKAIQQSSGGIKFGSTVEISGELTTRTDQDASSLAAVVQFFMNMAQMNSPTGARPELGALLQNLTVNTNANAVNVSLKIPEAELETLIKLAHRTGTSNAPRI